jgi:hypothetical protein
MARIKWMYEVRVGVEGNGETSFIITIYRGVPKAGGWLLWLFKELTI